MVSVSGTQNMIYIDLNGRNVKAFVGGTNLPKLQTLYLYNNQITSISTLYTPLLQTLYLYSNQLEYLPSDFFAYMTGLTTLYLQNNFLKDFPETVPSTVSTLNMNTNCLGARDI